MPKDNRQTIALCALACGAIAIAFAPIFVRLSEFGPIATAFYRVMLAWLPLWLWARSNTSLAQGKPTRRDIGWLCVPGVFFACDLSAWHWSIKLTTVANATLLANLAPVFVALWAWLFFKERFTRGFLFGLAAALIGLTLLSGASMGLGARYLWGDLLGVCTAVFYGAYILSVSRLRQRFATPHIMHWSALSSAAVLIVFTLIADEPLHGVSMAGWAVVLGLAWLSHAGGQSAIAFALAHLPATYSSLVLILQPLFAAVLAWFLFNEVLGPLQWLGGLVVLAGIALASSPGSLNRQRP